MAPKLKEPHNIKAVAAYHKKVLAMKKKVVLLSEKMIIERQRREDLQNNLIL